MSTRPEIELALDVRSYERIVVLSSPDSPHEYPESWVKPQKAGDLGQIDAETIVVVDRVEIQRPTLAAIGERGPRLIAFAPQGVDQEKSMRRMLTTLFPWAEVWTLFTAFGKVLVTKDARHLK